MFSLLKPHLSTLIEHFIFPLVCLTEEEIEMFNDDPTEYARQFFGGTFRCELLARMVSRPINRRTATGRVLIPCRATSCTARRLYCRLVRVSDGDCSRVPLDIGRDAGQDFTPPLAAVHPICRRQVRPGDPL